MSRLNADKRKQKIILTASRLFCKYGMHGTKTSLVAKRAKISEALLFKYFPDKSSLFAAILHHKMAERTPLLFDKLPLKKGPAVLLRELAWRHYSLHEQDPSFIRLLHFSVLEENKVIDLFFNERNLPLCDFLKTYFKEQMRQGTIKKANVQKTVMIYMSLINGFTTARLLFAIPDFMKFEAKSLLRDAIDVFLKGVLR